MELLHVWAVWSPFLTVRDSVNDSGPDTLTVEDKVLILNSGFKSKEHRTSDSCSFVRVNIFETVEFKGTA